MRVFNRNQISKEVSIPSNILFLIALLFGSCKKISQNSSLMVINLPELSIRDKYCKGDLKLKKSITFSIGPGLFVSSHQGNGCGSTKTLGLGEDAPKAGDRKTIIVIGAAGNQIEGQNALIQQYKDAGLNPTIVDISKSTNDTLKSDLTSQIQKQFPNGYGGDLDIVYNGHGMDPKDAYHDVINSKSAGNWKAKNGGMVIDQGTGYSKDTTTLSTILETSASAARGSQEKLGSTVGVVQSCFGGQNLCYLNESANKDASQVRNQYDSILYGASQDQPLAGQGMLHLNSEYIKLRGQEYDPTYDINSDGIVTMNEFQSKAPEKMTPDNDGIISWTGASAASLFLEQKSKDAIFKPNPEVYNGDFILSQKAK